MFRALSKVWWLLALCGIADAMCAGMNLLMLNPDGWLTARGFALRYAVREMSVLALVAGACAITAGIWNSGKGNSWLLALHGLALSAFGLIGVSPLVRGALSFRPISLLFTLMAVSVGAFALGAAQALPRGASDRWFLGVSGFASTGYAFSFVAVGFGWVRLGTPQSFWIWMSSYFAMCAIFMLYLARRAHSRGLSPSGPGEGVPHLPSPRHAH